MIEVHVVEGTTGEYEDRTEWPVVGFTDRARAEAFCKSINKWCQERSLHVHRYSGDDVPTNPYDPHMQVDYTGTEYHLYTVTVDPPALSCECHAQEFAPGERAWLKESGEILCDDGHADECRDDPFDKNDHGTPYDAGKLLDSGVTNR